MSLIILCIGLILGAIVGYSISENKYKAFEEIDKKWKQIHEDLELHPIEHDLDKRDFENRMLEREKKKKEQEDKEREEWHKAQLIHTGPDTFVPGMNVASAPAHHPMTHHTSHDTGHSSSYNSSDDSHSSHNSYSHSDSSSFTSHHH